MKIIYNVQCSIHEAAAVAVCSGAPQLDDAMPIEWRMDRLFECAPHKLSIETARRHRVSIKIYCTFDLAAVRGARHKTILGKWLNYWFLCVLCQGAVPLMFLFFAVLFFFLFRAFDANETWLQSVGFGEKQQQQQNDTLGVGWWCIEMVAPIKCADGLGHIAHIANMKLLDFPSRFCTNCMHFSMQASFEWRFEWQWCCTSGRRRVWAPHLLSIGLGTYDCRFWTRGRRVCWASKYARYARYARGNDVADRQLK